MHNAFQEEENRRQSRYEAVRVLKCANADIKNVNNGSSVTIILAQIQRQIIEMLPYFRRSNRQAGYHDSRHGQSGQTSSSSNIDSLPLLRHTEGGSLSRSSGLYYLDPGSESTIGLSMPQSPNSESLTQLARSSGGAGQTSTTLSQSRRPVGVPSGQFYDLNRMSVGDYPTPRPISSPDRRQRQTERNVAAVDALETFLKQCVDRSSWFAYPVVESLLTDRRQGIRKVFVTQDDLFRGLTLKTYIEVQSTRITPQQSGLLTTVQSFAAQGGVRRREPQISLPTAVSAVFGLADVSRVEFHEYEAVYREAEERDVGNLTESLGVLLS